MHVHVRMYCELTLFHPDMKTGINPRATGSAYVELGSTKVLCAM